MTPEHVLDQRHSHTLALHAQLCGSKARSYPLPMTRVHASTHKEPVRHRGQPVPATAPTRHAVLDLQRTGGNAATTALIQRTSPHHHTAAAPALNPPIVVARVADFGLRARAGISGYAG